MPLGIECIEIVHIHPFNNGFRKSWNKKLQHFIWFTITVYENIQVLLLRCFEVFGLVVSLSNRSYKKRFALNSFFNFHAAVLKRLNGKFSTYHNLIQILFCSLFPSRNQIVFKVTVCNLTVLLFIQFVISFWSKKGN